MATEIRVVLADDHPVVRHGVRQAIEQDRTLKVVGEAVDGASALTLIESLKPEIAVMDIEMPGLDGFSVARAIRERRLAVGVIFLTVHREESLFNEALSLGAKGYVLKDSAVTDIVSSIKAVAGGQSYTSPALTSYLFNRGIGRVAGQHAGAVVSRQPARQSPVGGRRRGAVRSGAGAVARRGLPARDVPRRHRCHADAPPGSLGRGGGAVRVWLRRARQRDPLRRRLAS